MNGDPGDSEGAAAPFRPPLVRLALVFYGVLLGAALLWGLLDGRSLFFASVEAAGRGVDPLRDLGAGLLAGGVVILLSRELTRRSRWGKLWPGRWPTFWVGSRSASVSISRRSPAWPRRPSSAVPCSPKLASLLRV